MLKEPSKLSLHLWCWYPRRDRDSGLLTPHWIQLRGNVPKSAFWIRIDTFFFKKLVLTYSRYKIFLIVLLSINWIKLCFISISSLFLRVISWCCKILIFCQLASFNLSGISGFAFNEKCLMKCWQITKSINPKCENAERKVIET